MPAKRTEDAAKSARHAGIAHRDTSVYFARHPYLPSTTSHRFFAEV